MERLTRRSYNGTAIYATPSGEPVKWENNRHKVLQKLADYEDAEEQGLLLRLPISEDTPVYSIEYCCGRNRNNRFGMCFRGFCKDCDDKTYYIREGTAEYCSICEIQKSVFFTREEAEAKLAEMEGAE